MYEEFSSEDEEWDPQFKQSTYTHGAADKPLKWSLSVQVLPGIGDRVYLPAQCLEELSGRLQKQESGGPMTFKLTSKERSTHCGVKEFTSGDGSIGLTEEIAQSLSLKPGDSVVVRHCTLARAAFCVLQPLQSEFFGIPDHKAALESLLRQHHVTLTEGQCISMPWSGTNTLRRTISDEEVEGRVPVYELGVVSLKPSTAVCIIDCDMEVEIQPLEGTSDGFRHTMLAIGASATHGEVEGQQYEYFEVPIDETLESVQIDLISTEGDADLFASASGRFPSRSDHTWRSIEPGNASLSITKHDPRLVWENTPLIYVGVRGYALHTKFSIQATRAQVPAPRNQTAKRKRMALGPNIPVPEGMVRCEHCRQDISASAIMLHSAQCARNNWVCSTCNQVLPLEEKDSHVHCPQCPLVFTSVEAMTKHIGMIHDLLKCKCGAMATMDQMAHHRKTECPLRQVVCRFCGSMFEAGLPPADHRDRLNGLTAHESECGSRTDKCTVCGKYVRLKEMDAHLALHNFLKAPETAAPPESSSEWQCTSCTLLNDPSSTVCSMCGTARNATTPAATPAVTQQLPVQPVTPPALCANCCVGFAKRTTNADMPSAAWNFGGSPHVVLCQHCQQKVPSTTETPDPKAWAQKLVKLYFGQLTKGCGNSWCTNQQCATGSSTSMAANEAVVKAVQLAKDTGNQEAPCYYLCLTESEQQACERHKNLIAMGFPAEWAAHALMLKENDVDRAVLWLLEEGHGQ